MLVVFHKILLSVLVLWVLLLKTQVHLTCGNPFPDHTSQSALKLCELFVKENQLHSEGSTIEFISLLLFNELPMKGLSQVLTHRFRDVDRRL